MEDGYSIDLSNRDASHVRRVVYDLASVGWTPKLFPADGKLSSNHQVIELRTPDRSLRIRLSVYKVGGRGEQHRLHQQRIEITTTYASGLVRRRDWNDVVLGYDAVNDAYVGLDPRRLSLGGTTHNASTSIDPAALVAASNSRVVVRPHESRSFGLEYQAFFGPARLSEYLFNYRRIHDGQYRDDGILSGAIRRVRAPETWTIPIDACKGGTLVLNFRTSRVARKRPPAPALVEALENQETTRFSNLSPEDFEKIQRRCQQVGDSGEAFVYKSELRRLHRAGRSDLAERVTWVSQTAVGRGYDIKSYEIDGTPRYIEVKATIGVSRTFFVSSNEWRVATRLRQSYCIVRVTRALDQPRIMSVLRDPVGAETINHILRVPEGWRITLLGALAN